MITITLGSLRYPFCTSEYGMKKFKKACAYSCDAEIRFRKYKGQLLKVVYKIDPHYIEWCIIHSEGFVIHPDDFVKLKNQKVFEHSDLQRFVKKGENGITIDLSTFSHNLTSPSVEEIPFEFSSLAISRNNEKLEKTITCSDAFTGGSWDVIGNSRPFKSIPVKIILPH